MRLWMVLLLEIWRRQILLFIIIIIIIIIILFAIDFSQQWINYYKSIIGKAEMINRAALLCL